MALKICVILTLIIGAVVCTLAADEPLARDSVPPNYDVVVVGAGLSGLTTGLRLAKGGVDKVLVLEALDEFGGRTKSQYIQGNRVSKGGTWALFENRATLQLASQVGAPPFIPLLAPRQAGIENIAAFPFLLLDLWFEVGFQSSAYSDDFWTWPQAASYDSISLEDWMSSKVDSLAPTLGATWVSKSKQAVRDWLWLWENINVTNPQDLSGMSALAAGQFVYQRIRGLSNEGLYTLGIFRWDNGTGVLVDAVVQALRDAGGEAIAKSPVSSIDYTRSDYIAITLKNGLVYHASRVVIATAPASAANIVFTPPLPTAHQHINTDIIPSDAGSVQVFLTWRGLAAKWYTPFSAILPSPSGQPAKGAYGEVFEVTPQSSPDGVFRVLALNPNASYDAIINGLTGAAATSAIQTAYVNWFTQVFGSLYTLPISAVYNTTVWDWRTQKPYISGIVFYWAPNSTLVNYGSGLRTPVADNRIFWGSAERAVHGLNWMEGAVQRGNQVACDILQQMGIIANCTVYMNYIDYLFNTTVAPSLLSQPNYIAAMQQLQLIVCLAIQQNSFACPVTSSISPSTSLLWRTASMNVYESAVHGQVLSALSTLQMLDKVAVEVGQQATSLLSHLL